MVILALNTPGFADLLVNRPISPHCSPPINRAQDQTYVRSYQRNLWYFFWQDKRNLCKYSCDWYPYYVPFVVMLYIMYIIYFEWLIRIFDLNGFDLIWRSWIYCIFKFVFQKDFINYLLFNFKKQYTNN